MTDKTKEELIEQIKLLQKRIAEFGIAPNEDKQQQQIRRLATVVLDSNDAITLIDFDGRIIAWNRGAEQMYGYSEKEALEMNIDHLTPPGKVSEQREFGRRLIAGETVVSFETQRVAKDGRILDVWLTVTKVLDDTRKPIGIATTERDITERKKAEENSKNSQRLLQRIIDLLPIRVFWKDKNLKYLGCNEVFAKDTGRNRSEDLIGKDDFQMGWKEQANIYRNDDQRVINSGKARLNIEEPQTTPKGDKIWLKTNKVPLTDTEGNIIGILGSYEDITERKLDEENLQKNISFLKLSHSLAGIGSWEHNPATQTTLWDENMFQIYGLDSKQGVLSFEKIAAMIHPEDRAMWEKMIDSTEKTQEMEFRIIRPDGECRFLHAKESVYHRAEEGQTYFYGVIRDITESRSTENSLRNSEEKYRSLFEGSKDAIMTLAPPSWKFTSGNPATMKIFGAKNEKEFVSYGPWEVSPDRQPDGRASAEKIKEMIETAMREGSYFSEWTCKRLNGEEFFATVFLTRMRLGGLEFLQATVRNITEFKQAEEALRSSQNMLIQSEKLASLGKLVSSMAHEVNNPLMIISGNAQLSLMEGTKEEEIKNNLKIIMEECLRAKNIIQRLLKFSRPSKGETKEVDINKSIEDVVGIVERQFKLVNVEIKRNYQGSLPPISIDSQEMQEVFINLINNAAEAMPGGGVITITTSLEGDSLSIVFKDTGFGIPEEFKKRIFEPFFTTKEKGTGLGLPVCYGIIKAHNGEIKFESELNKGTTVSVLLPLGGG